MARYLVTMMLYQTCEVEADDADEAREKANFEVPAEDWTSPEPDGPFYVDLLHDDAEIDARALAHEAATNSD